MTERRSVIVIGGGVNGLACASYLARAGHSVQLFEAAPQLGGCAATFEIEPGLEAPRAAHLLYQLHPRLITELELERYGLTLDASCRLETVVLHTEAPALRLGAGQATGGRLSPRDEAQYRLFHERTLRYARYLDSLCVEAPPRLAPSGLRDAARLASAALGLRRLGREDMREFLRVAGINVFDVLNEYFASEPLKGAIAFDAVLGTFMGPRSPHSMLAYLYRLSGLAAGGLGLSLPAGGIGAVTRALVAVARSAGVVLRTSTPVRRILSGPGGVEGVELESGETVRAAVVVSSADPKTTLLELLGPAAVDTGFGRSVHNIRTRGLVAQVSIILDGAPTFTGLAPGALRDRLLIAPSLAALESAFDCAKYGDVGDVLPTELVFHGTGAGRSSGTQRTLATALVNFVPCDRRGGWDEAARAALGQRVVDSIAVFAPDFRARMQSLHVQTPADLALGLRLAGGHWHHGEFALDRFLTTRPVVGFAQYAMPVAGLWLCGAGVHPGGSISGLAGRNAAREILRTEVRR